MQMIGHNDVAMDKVVAPIAIMKNRIFHNRGNRRRSEKPSSLPRVGCDEVRCSGLCAMFRSSHLASGAKAPLLLSLYGGAEAPPFRADVVPAHLGNGRAF